MLRADRAQPDCEGMTRRELLALPLAAAATAAPAGELAGPVQRFADTLLEAAPDRYGRQSSPLWAAVIDAEDFTVPEDGVPAPTGVRSSDRALLRLWLHEQGRGAAARAREWTF